MSINWDMLESATTFLAVMLALLFGLRDVIDRRRNRPQITLEHRNEPPYVNSDEGLKQLNLKTTNKGRVTAKNLNLRIQKITQNGKSVNPEKFPLDIYGEIQSLRSGDSVFVPLVEVTRKDADWMEIPNSGFRFRRADTEIYVLVVGENVVGLRKSFRFVNSSDLSKVRLEENKARIQIEIRLVRAEEDQRKAAEPSLP